MGSAPSNRNHAWLHTQLKLERRSIVLWLRTWLLLLDAVGRSGLGDRARSLGTFLLFLHWREEVLWWLERTLLLHWRDVAKRWLLWTRFQIRNQWAKRGNRWRRRHVFRCVRIAVFRLVAFVVLFGCALLHHLDWCHLTLCLDFRLARLECLQLLLQRGQLVLQSLVLLLQLGDDATLNAQFSQLVTSNAPMVSTLKTQYCLLEALILDTEALRSPERFQVSRSTRFSNRKRFFLRISLTNKILTANDIVTEALVAMLAQISAQLSLKERRSARLTHPMNILFDHSKATERDANVLVVGFDAANVMRSRRPDE